MADERAAVDAAFVAGGARAESGAPGPLDLLARQDKWQLGVGDAVAFAPTFPSWLDAPGFWDNGSIFHYPFGPLFTVAVLGTDGHELPVRLASRRWTPAELTCEYRLPGGITATEIRTVQPGGVFASEWRVHAPRATVLHLIAWTAQPAGDVDLGSVAWNGAISFVRTVRDETGATFRAAAELTCIGEATSWAAALSDDTPRRPDWQLTPFVDPWTSTGHLTSSASLGEPGASSVLYAAVHRVLDLSSADLTQTFAIRIGAADPALRPSAASDAGALTRPITPSRRVTLAPGTPSLASASRRRWHDLFDGVPHFECSDPYLQTYYWYRWYGLWLNAVPGGAGYFQHPTVCEGVGDARRPAALAVPSLVRELRWTNPALARSLIRSFFAHQREDGRLPRHLYVDRVDERDADDADWGGAFDALDSVAPDAKFAAEMYFRLARYGDWLIRTRDPESSGLYGAAAPARAEGGRGRDATLGRAPAATPSRDRSRATAAEPPIKSVVVTVYAYALLRVLERLAAESGQRAESARWGGAADRTRRAVRDRMWSVELSTFADVDPGTGKCTGGRTDDGFLPFTTDLATDDHRQGLERTLLDPTRFWTPFPVPSLAADDPRFDPSGVSDGVRRAAPTNGRVWPASVSVVLDVLAGGGRERIPRFREAAAHLISRSVRMRFLDGDPSLPNAYEHYSPLTGAPSLFRGRDDHMPGWVNDGIIRYVAGVRPRTGGVTVDPLPLGLDRLQVTGVAIQGHEVGVSIDGERYAVTVDGAAQRGALGTPTDVSW